MVCPKEIILIGGGSSIREGLALNLKEKLEGKCGFTLNFSFRHFNSTAEIAIDESFYRGFILGNGITKDQSHVDALKELPFIIAPKLDFVRFYENTITLPFSDTYHKDPLKRGFYIGEKALCGIFALHIASWIASPDTSIYLLGFDGGALEGQDTHYYSDIKHKGMGLTNIYEVFDTEKSYKNFISKDIAKIYNVSPYSNLHCFEKIDYSTFFTLLSEDKYDQTELRQYIREKLTWKKE